MMTDPIADMLTRIRNAQMASHVEVEIPRSKIKLSIAKLLEREGLIKKVLDRAERTKRHARPSVFVIQLKYRTDNMPVMSELRRVSTPGQRIYSGKEFFGHPKFTYGIKIISTSKGILTHKDALEQKVGGEILCEIV